MSRVLSVAEKPSVARKIAQIMARGGHIDNRGGPSKYNRIFEFNMRLGGQDIRMVVTSVTGHLMEVAFAEGFRKWNSCSPEALFEAPVFKRVPDDKKDVEKNLQNQARRCQRLILWLDCDREGENIAFEVIEVCRGVNPSIGISRAQFSSLIPSDIFRACETLRQPNEDFSIAVDTRQEIDLRLGAIFTRWQTQYLQKRFEGLDDIISYGPCQFPTMGFVVERYLKRKHFISEPFWKIVVTHRPEEGKEASTAVFRWNRVRLFCHFTAALLFEMCVENPIATVVNASGKNVKKYRPYPLATVDFQKRAARTLRMDSKRAMEIAEKLYQRGILSYPRTETNKFKKEFDFRALVQVQTASPAFGQYAARLLEGDFRRPREGKDDDGAHPPIHPKIFDPSLSGDEKRIYDLVARHFLACCSADAEGHMTTVEIQIGYEFFKATGLMVLAKNWLDVYPYEKWNGNTMPRYQVGEKFEPTRLFLEEGKTEPPPLLSEADLISLMNQNGIGTDATIAEHIDKVKQRKYVFVNNRQFIPSELGIGLVQGYKRMEIAMATPALRQQMERDINLISEGKKTKDEVLQECLEHMKDVYLTVMENHGLLSAEISEHFPPLGEGDSKTLRRSFTRCGNCGRTMSLRKSGEKRFVRCEACSQSHFLPKGSLHPYDFECPLCKFQVVEVTNPKTKKSHKVCPWCFNNPPQQDIEDIGKGGFRCFLCSEPSCKIATKRDDKPVRPCRKCNGMMAIRSSNKNNKKSLFLGCLKYPKCDFSMYIFGAKTAELTDTQCHKCSKEGRPAYKLKLSFSREPAVPPSLSCMPYVEGCPGCSGDLMDVIRVKSTSSSTYKRKARSQNSISSSAQASGARYPRLGLHNAGDRKPRQYAWGNPGTSVAGGWQGNGNNNPGGSSERDFGVSRNNWGSNRGTWRGRGYRGSARGRGRGRRGKGRGRSGSARGRGSWRGRGGKRSYQKKGKGSSYPWKKKQKYGS